MVPILDTKEEAARFVEGELFNYAYKYNVEKIASVLYIRGAAVTYDSFWHLVELHAR